MRLGTDILLQTIGGAPYPEVISKHLATDKDEVSTAITENFLGLSPTVSIMPTTPVAMQSDLRRSSTVRTWYPG